MICRHLRQLLSLAIAGIFLAVGAATFSGSAGAGYKLVQFDHDYPVGAIVIVNKQRKLYYVLGGGKALQYPVAIGTPSNVWTGRLFVQDKKVNPSWTPPWNPRKTVPGGPGNPLGVRAIYLGWTLYRIHGTTSPGSIGRAASHGCIRMFNKDVVDLYERVHIGAPVHVVRSLDKSTS